MIREVYIELKSGTWFVRYTKRGKFQRHLAAQFDARFRSRDYVKDWVKSQPNLKLTIDQ